MSKITRAWIDAQIEKEMERGTHPDAIRDLAALFTVRGHMCGDDDMRQYGRRYDPDHEHVEHHAPADGTHLSRDEADEWVRGIVADDGRKGARWSLNEIRQAAAEFGVHEDKVVEFYAVMNALYADYGMVARKHGVDKVDFWADMAKAFMHDKDAAPDKVKRYYEYIVDHD